MRWIFLSFFTRRFHDSWVVCWNLENYICSNQQTWRDCSPQVLNVDEGAYLTKKTPQISIWWNFKHRSTVLACIHHTHIYNSSTIQIHTAITADKSVSYVTYIDIASSVVLYNQGNRTPLIKIPISTWSRDVRWTQPDTKLARIVQHTAGSHILGPLTSTGAAWQWLPHFAAARFFGGNPKKDTNVTTNVTLVPLSKMI